MIHRHGRALLFLFAAIVGFVTVPASAHHSFAMFNRGETASIEGVVKEFAWTNPHVLIDIDVSDEHGRTARYRIESASTNILMRQGWKVGSIKAGDRVTIVFNPLKSGLPGGLLIEVTLPNGAVLKG